jgi:hypothetical protein
MTVSLVEGQAKIEDLMIDSAQYGLILTGNSEYPRIKFERTLMGAPTTSTLNRGRISSHSTRNCISASLFPMQR